MEPWLPTGNHWGLHVSRVTRPDAGPFAIHVPDRIVLHTTEGSGMQSMLNVLQGKHAEPHFLIDPTPGDIPTPVIQMVPMHHASKALEHVGTVQTNHAHAIQIEIVDFAKLAATHSEYWYRDLAALCVLIEHRTNVKRHFATFHTAGNVQRMSHTDWLRFNGYCGHQHVPDQPSGHWDPGVLNTVALRRELEAVSHRYA